MTEPTPPAPRRARHLMDPAQPRRRTTPEDLERLQRVQRWVMSALVTTTILHLSVGLVIASAHLDSDKRSAVVGINLLASAFGVVAVAAALAIHRRSVLSPWLLLGVVPGLVGLLVVG